MFKRYTCGRAVVAERSSALDSSSGVVRMWVRIPAWLVASLVSLSKTLNHNCFVLQMGRKAVGPVCCVMHVNEPRILIVKEKGACPGVSGCARYKFSVLLLCGQTYLYAFFIFRDWLDKMPGAITPHIPSSTSNGSATFHLKRTVNSSLPQRGNSHSLAS